MSWWYLGQVRNWVTWSQKLGHWTKSAENLVNTRAVTFFKQSSWILLKMFVLMISRSSLKLGHSFDPILMKLKMFASIKSRSSLILGYLGSKTHQVKSKEKLVNTLEVIVLTQSWWNLLKMFASIKSRSLGHLGSKTRSPGHHESSNVCQQVKTWVTWCQKTRSPGQTSRNLVNTLAVTFLKQ